MYNTYIWKLKPLSSQMTLWQSDTIYGHLLYGASLLYGDDYVENLIKQFEENPPFIVSDGFIDGMLPMINKGVVKRSDTEEFSKIYGQNQIETVKKLKEINKIKNISIEDFNRLREGNFNKKDFIIEKLKETKENSKNSTKKTETISVIHNVINRLNGSTGDNGIFPQKEIFINGDIHIFIKVRKDFNIGELDELLKFVESNGYGKKVSSGHGAIKRITFEKFDGFKEIKGADAFITLSNYIPKEFDYDEVISCTPLVKKGKVYQYMEFPFKKPFSCFMAGSLFKKSQNKFYGKVLRNVHIDKKIVQIGIPFTLEVKL